MTAPPDRFTGTHGEDLNNLTHQAHAWERKGMRNGAQALRDARWSLWDSQTRWLKRDRPQGWPS
jgi:hypothetical protein